MCGIDNLCRQSLDLLKGCRLSMSRTLFCPRTCVKSHPRVLGIYALKSGLIASAKDQAYVISAVCLPFCHCVSSIAEKVMSPFH